MQADPLAWIPNQAGYKFWGLTHAGEWRLCEVERNADGMHTLKGGMFRHLKGWASMERMKREGRSISGIVRSA